MSCDVTKLEYLKETKEIFRQKLDPKGKTLSESTPFRSYADLMSSGASVPVGTAYGYAYGAEVTPVVGTATEYTEVTE